MSTALRFENLSKTFGRRQQKVQAVKNIDLEIGAGQVYGFLGPNGAGKSTTIRMAMDLIRPTTGDVYIFDRPLRQEHHVLKRVGALVEGASFYDFLTGRKNLELLARTSGQYSAGRVQLLLAQVGMVDRADRLVKGYSTGMKQRLGLAAALLNDPDLVILDEPTNGLDPAGIQEMRGFIRRLVANEGKTIFLSSHILSEVELMCDRVAIIDQGEIVREGLVADLLAAGTQLEIEAKPLAMATAVLREKWQMIDEGEENGRFITVRAVREEAPQVVAALVSANVNVYQVRIQRQSLEQFFLQVTEKEHSEAS